MGSFRDTDMTYTLDEIIRSNDIRETPDGLINDTKVLVGRGPGSSWTIRQNGRIVGHARSLRIDNAVLKARGIEGDLVFVDRSNLNLGARVCVWEASTPTEDVLQGLERAGGRIYLNNYRRIYRI